MLLLVRMKSKEFDLVWISDCIIEWSAYFVPDLLPLDEPQNIFEPKPLHVIS